MKTYEVWVNGTLYAYRQGEGEAYTLAMILENQGYEDVVVEEHQEEEGSETPLP